MDRYYTLEFFIIPAPDGLPSNFLYPSHFDDVDAAKVAAEYWLKLGAFNAVKCKYVENGEPWSTISVLDIPFFIRADGTGGYA